MSEKPGNIIHEDVVKDEGVDYDVTTLVLQAFQVDPREVHVSENMTISDFYFYHFQELTPKNDELFKQMINHAIIVLGVPVMLDLKITDLVKVLEKNVTNDVESNDIVTNGVESNVPISSQTFPEVT